MSKEPGRDLQPGGRSATEEDLRRLFRLSLDLMCVAGLDGYFKKVNPAFEKVLGYDQKELLARQFIEFVHPDDQEATLHEVANLAEGAITIDFENRYRTHSGDYRWLAWRSAPDVESGLIYAVARDITEQKRNQGLLESRTEELARSNADLEQFAYVASHDLRAPLRSIVTLANFIEDDLGDGIPDNTRAHVTELRRRTLLMKALVDDLLVYAQAGRVSEKLVEVDAAQLVRSIAFMLDTPDEFEIRFEGEVPILETFRGPFEQVLRNLLGNAVKHHDRAEGAITITASDRGDFWELAVHDDGPGMTDEAYARIFDVGRQLEAPRGPEISGMGLPIVQRIVEGFGGEVKIDRGEGRGTTSRFTWPKKMPGNSPTP
jgi:PAS domain S-box-containing protein